MNEKSTQTGKQGGRFSTPDLHEAAFLLIRGHSVLGIEWGGDGRRGFFIFEDNAALRADLREFADDVQVPMQTFISGTYRAKRLLREAERLR